MQIYEEVEAVAEYIIDTDSRGGDVIDYLYASFALLAEKEPPLLLE